MTAPTLAALASAHDAATEAARQSDLSALRSIIRHLDILAEDYAADFDLRNSLRRAARWAAHACDALQARKPTTPKPTPKGTNP